VKLLQDQIHRNSGRQQDSRYEGRARCPGERRHAASGGRVRRGCCTSCAGISLSGRTILVRQREAIISKRPGGRQGDTRDVVYKPAFATVREPDPQFLRSRCMIRSLGECLWRCSHLLFMGDLLMMIGTGDREYSAGQDAREAMKALGCSSACIPLIGLLEYIDHQITESRAQQQRARRAAAVAGRSSTATSRTWPHRAASPAAR